MALSGSRRSVNERGGFRDINVTPLVDVMLVLLIVFMATAPLLATGLHVDLPEVQAANMPLKDAKLVLSISRDERIVFDGHDVTEDLEHVLDTNKRVQAEHELYILADKGAHYGIVARAVAAARAAGVKSLNLLVDPEESKRR